MGVGGFFKKKKPLSKNPSREVLLKNNKLNLETLIFIFN